MELTLRLALARNKMKPADLRRATEDLEKGKRPISFDTINKILDEIPPDGVSLGILNRVAAAVPGVELRVQFLWKGEKP